LAQVSANPLVLIALGIVALRYVLALTYGLSR
jgi:hypothetical protein